MGRRYRHQRCQMSLATRLLPLHQKLSALFCSFFEVEFELSENLMQLRDEYLRADDRILTRHEWGVENLSVRRLYD